MAASLSRPDPSSPASVAEARFSTSRRGFTQDEVRAFLTSVAAELGRLQESERQLEAQLAATEVDVAPTPELDEATVAAMVGEETLHVLQTARESASQIKVRAEESAARILRDANDEVNRVRQDAEVESARKRHDASSDAEAEVASAKQQGREMVNEARAYRERVLADLERRTKVARQHIEDLVHGRDRLLQVFERARLVAVDVTSELQSVDAPEEFVNLSPTTGPLPIMLPAAEMPIDSSLVTMVDDADVDAGFEPADTSAESEIEATVDASTEVVADDVAADDTTAGDEETESTEIESNEIESIDDASADDSEATAVVDDEIESNEIESIDDASADDSEPTAEADDDDDDDDDDGANAVPPKSPARDANVVSLFRERASDGEPDDEVVDGEVDRAEEPVEVDRADEPDETDEGEPAFDGVVEADEPDPPTDEPVEGEPASDGVVEADVPGPPADEPDPPADVDDIADHGDRPDVGGIFERLRNETPVDDSEPSIPDDDDSESAADAESTPFSRRDEAIVPLIVAGARKLKRVLADEQNGVLDLLRQNTPVTQIDELIPEIDEHAQTYLSALDDDLIEAAVAGASEVGKNDTKTLRTTIRKGALDPAHEIVRDDLVTPLRARLERAIGDGAGDNEDIAKRIRAVYREWKTQHIDHQLDDAFRFAYGGGTAVGAKPGTAMQWMIDPAEPTCADCEDNSLAGVVDVGDRFPTGHASAPAHAGCRCLTVPTSQ